MKLVLIKQKYVPFGGGEGYLARLLTAASERGHEVHLVTSSWPDDHTKQAFTVHTVKMRRHSRAARSGSFSRAAAEAARRLEADCVLTLDRTEGADIWRAGEGVHQVWLERRKQFEPPWKVALNARSRGQQALLRLEAACAASVRTIIANSNLVAHDLNACYPDLQARVEVIHNGIDLERFSTAGREDHRRRMRAGDDAAWLFVGSGFRRKGLRETLQALSEVPGARLKVLGRDRPDSWRTLAQRLGVEQRVQFLGPRKDLVPHYHAADLLVFPSWFESFGFVGLEAMACGTPVVTSRYAGVHELVTEEGGRVIDRPDDQDRLVAAIRGLQGRLPDPDRVSASVSDASLETNLERTLAVLEAAG